MTEWGIGTPQWSIEFMTQEAACLKIASYLHYKIYLASIRADSRPIMSAAPPGSPYQVKNAISVLHKHPPWWCLAPAQGVQAGPGLVLRSPKAARVTTARSRKIMKQMLHLRLGFFLACELCPNDEATSVKKAMLHKMSYLAEVIWIPAVVEEEELGEQK